MRLVGLPNLKHNWICSLPKAYRTKPDWTLRVVGEINVDAFAERVSRITPEEWDEWKQRQKSVHKQARAVPFQWCHNISGYDPDKDDEFNDINDWNITTEVLSSIDSKLVLIGMTDIGFDFMVLLCYREPGASIKSLWF